ncbi:MAG: oligosaccharide flippase family protein [Nitrospiraceae bacterium]|nr:oligosaccharide flippase family protein [Nitrospiraceae bacterium]
MSTDRKLASLTRVTTILLVGRVAGFSLLLVNSIVIARVLGVEALGEYGYAMGLAALFGLVPNLGITTVITRAIAQDPDHSLGFFKTALRTQAMLAGLVFLAVVGVAAVLPRQLVPVSYAALAALQLTVGSFSWPYLAVLGGRSRYDRLAVAELITGSGGTFLIVGTALFGGSVTAFLVVHVVTAAASNVIARAIAGPFLPPHDGPHCSFRELLRQAFPFGGGAIVQSLYSRIDLVLLGQLSAAGTVGLYSAAYKPINMVVNFGSSAAGTLFPYLVQEAKTGPSGTYQRVQRLFLVVAPLLALAFSGLARPLLTTLYGADFAAAGSMLSILAWAAAAKWLCAPVAIALQARGLERWWMIGLLVAFVVNVCVNWWAIPRWGGEGAAMATVVCEAGLLVSGMGLLHHRWRIAPPVHTILAAGVATFCSAVLLLALRPWGDVSATIGAVSCYAALTLLLRIATADDVAKLVGRFRESVYGHARA